MTHPSMVVRSHRRYNAEATKTVTQGQPDGYGDYVRFSWDLGPAGQVPAIDMACIP
jgi:hypothetical protein